MGKKFIVGLGIFAWSVGFLVAGIFIAFLAFTGLELNDRLKYEAAYLKGYVKAQSVLKEGDTEKASEIFDFLIDAHVKTLSEFQYLESSELSYDIDAVLCEAVALRKKYPAPRTGEGKELMEWYKEIDDYLIKKSAVC